MFNIGQEVECICDDWFGLHGYPCDGPKKGEILTIKEIRPPISDKMKKDDYLYFREMPAGYASSYFRPIQKKSTDISVFTKMLKTKETENV